MKSVLISIQPQWCELIASGKKTIEVRKSASKEVPFKAYIYMTHNGNKFIKKIQTSKDYDIYTEINYKIAGKIIGEFICDRVIKYEEHIEEGGLYYTLENDFNEACQLDNWELHDYGKGKPIYAWHISDLKIYDKPKELGEFVKPCDWNYDCCTCKRAVYELTQAEAKVFYGCDREITRAPQSWQYVEEVEE